MSCAVVYCPAAGRPDAVRNTVFAMPSSCAVRVMRRAKAASLPERFSAMVTAASLADKVTMARMASPAVIVSPGFSHSLTGACAAACAETRNGVSSVTCLRSSSPNSR